MRVGYAVESPYAFVTARGRVTGESPETARLVARQLGWHIDWVQTSFDELIPDLLAGRFDVIAAGMFVTPQRAQRIAFSVPTLAVRPGLLLRRGSGAGLKSYRDLVKAPLRHLAVLSGSQEQHDLLAAGMPAGRLLVLPSASDGRVAVEAGAADALALSLPTVRGMAAGSSGGLEAHAMVGGGTGDADGPAAQVAFGISLGEPALLAAWDAAAARVVGSEAHLDAIAPFGFTREDLPAARHSAP